jgi:hypothetical protein
MAATTDLQWADKNNGRTYATGSQQVHESGSTLSIESGASLKLAGTAITSNASEINSLDGVSTSWPTLLPGSPTFTIGSESSNAINVLCSLNDITGTAIAASKVVFVYLSDSAVGDGIIATAPDGGFAIGTDGAILVTHTASKAATIWTESDGDFDITITHAAGAKTLYVCVTDGFNLFVSSAVTFA